MQTELKFNIHVFLHSNYCEKLSTLTHGKGIGGVLDPCQTYQWTELVSSDFVYFITMHAYSMLRPDNR